MNEVTQILDAINTDPQAASQLLPLVYDELRRLAAHKLNQEKAGQTLQPTALVHEAYLRLVGENDRRAWDGRGHFFAAAAEAMRRILIDNARRKKRHKHGGDRRRVELADQGAAAASSIEALLALDDVLDKLAEEDPAAASVVKLRVFAEFSIEEAAEALGMARATAYRHWVYAKAWLKCALEDPAPP